MNTRKLAVLVLCAALLLTGLTACAGKAPEPAAEDEYIKIQTDFGPLYYPAHWEEFLNLVQTPMGDTLELSFEGMAGGRVYPLFVLQIGAGGGAEIGQLTDEAGNVRTVYMTMTELDLDETLSEGEQNRLYAMQEDVNYIIDHLQ